MCKAITRSRDSNPSTAPPSSSATLATNVWAEHAPPRLDSEAVQRMPATFKANHPGEHLDSDCMPSIRLLSLVHLWFAPRGIIKWVPWQLRMSQKQYQDLFEACTSRTLRTEAQLVSSALFDGTPELSLGNCPMYVTLLPEEMRRRRNALTEENSSGLLTVAG